MSDVLDCVAKLIDAGLPVFPCRADKAPACPRGFLAASIDRATVSDLFALPGSVLVGVPTGAASGVDILDIDPRHNGDAWWRREAYRLPATRAHRTRSNGLHLLFRADVTVRCSQAKIAPGIDVRGGGGYAVWWACHGGQVTNPTTLANWPGWLLDAMRPRPQPAPPPRTRQLNQPDQPAPGAAQRIFEAALAKLEQAAEGERHITLRRAAFTTGGILAHLGMTRAQAVTELVTAVMHSGARDQNNATKTALWAIERGEQSPLTMGGRS